MESNEDIASTDDDPSVKEVLSTEIFGNISPPYVKSYSSKRKEKENKYELSAEYLKQLEQFPEILEFIKMLQKCIEKQKKKLKKSKKERVKTKSVSTQTEPEAYKNPSTIEAKPNLVNKSSKSVKSVTEEITEAAQQALQTNGFVYEETSGLYYDYSSGYYYNAEYGLYYDGNTGTYLKYNQDTKKYEFHSQTEVQTTNNEENLTQPKNSSKNAKTKSKKRPKPKRDELHDDDEEDTDDKFNTRAASDRKRMKVQDLEDGECSDISESSSNSSTDSEDIDIDITKQYPPCMRIIVEDTAIPSLKAGSLHLLTYEGGSIGREGTHALLLPEINTSKFHAKISYDTEKCAYFLIDCGSRNGTLLNGKRIAPAKVESDPVEIPHGSKIQIGSTILLCHIHSGSQTCGHCEPGLLINLQPKQMDDVQQVLATKTSDHKHQLKQLRKKFGLTQNDQGKTDLGAGYKDRAMQRRSVVGSQNPHEKTQVASLDESIASNNKGFKLLAKMGWKEGQALGKDNQGILEPVGLVSNPGTSGMGSSAETKVIQPSLDFQPLSQNKSSSKHSNWAKAQERYKHTENQTRDDIFDLTDI